MGLEDCSNGSGGLIQTNTAPLRRHPLYMPSLNCCIMLSDSQATNLLEEPMQRTWGRSENEMKFHKYKWDVLVNEIPRKPENSLILLLQLKRSGIPVDDLLMVYMMVVRSTLECACPSWSTSLTVGLQRYIDRIERRAMDIIHPNTFSI